MKPESEPNKTHEYQEYLLVFLSDNTKRFKDHFLLLLFLFYKWQIFALENVLLTQERDSDIGSFTHAQ